MFPEKKEGTVKKNNRIVYIGYDLGDTYAQISYCMADGQEPETLSVVTGTEQYNIPMVLCKRREVNQWFYGKEALKFAQEENGILVENLLELARAGEMVDVGGENFDPAALMTLFVRRSLSMLTIVAPPEYIGGMMFTAVRLDKRMVEVLAKVAANLHLRTDKIFYQSHMESFYCYTLCQPEELWKHEVFLFHYDYKGMTVYSLGCNRKTTPMVVFAEAEEYEEMELEESVHGSSLDEYTKKQLDEKFYEIVKEKCNGRAVSCVYLIGEGFKESWAAESLRYLCRGRRVFQGNNLYSKGACYGIIKKLGLKENQAEYVFLGRDKLKSNIGMKLLRKGIDSYYALMDAGVNWYEAGKELDVILESGNTISIILTPLNGREPREINMILEDIPARPNWTTRLRITADMLSENQMSIKVRDLGFGEFFPPSGGEWIKVFEV